MHRQRHILLHASLLIALAAGVASQEPAGSADRAPKSRDGARAESGSGRHRAGSHDSRRRQIRENLERWRHLDPKQREALRRRIVEAMGGAIEKGAALRDRLLENAERLNLLTPEEREQIRRRSEEFRRHFERQSPEERARERELRERLDKMDPLARKRYFYLRQLLAQLPHEEQEAMKNLPKEERQQATQRLLVQKGPMLFLREVARVSPAVQERLKAMGGKEARQVFRRWVQEPSGDLRAFLRRENLLREDDPPGRLPGRPNGPRGPHGHGERPR